MKTTIFILFSLIIFVITGCEKAFLDKKPDKALLVPSSYEDLQSLLDNSNLVMNFSPFLSIMAGDEVHVADNGFAAAQIMDQNAYLWADDVYDGSTVNDWNRQYQQVLYANVVLDRLKEMQPMVADRDKHQHLQGSALFFRAFAFYQLLQEFAPAYKKAEASRAPGIPLRLESDIRIISRRATLEASYQQVTNDLKTATELLPTLVGFKTRPSKKAALALLSRIYLSMQDYTQAFSYAEACLSGGYELLNFNTITNKAFPMPPALPNGNAEVIFYAITPNFQTVLKPSASGISPALYQEYKDGDLRKTLFFNTPATNIFSFKGSYTGNGVPFTGLAFDEILLIKAECLARAGNQAEAIGILQALDAKRYVPTKIPDYGSVAPSTVLGLILTERKKELLLRGVRWTDLRRLSADPMYEVTIYRNYLGQSYELKPGDKRYTFQIPNDVMAATGIQPNAR